MNPQKKFHLVFSIVMGTIMVSVMTLIITLANVGWIDGFVQLWFKAFSIAYVVAVPIIFFLAPVARRLTGRILGMPA
jgi:uncharacterized protein YaaW (UPF0174 family)